MTLKEMRQRELDDQKERRKEEVVLAAITVFKHKSIDQTKMTDIAQEAKVGVASVYRYFKTKMDLVIEVATWMWKVEISPLYSIFQEESYLGMKGIQQVEAVLHVFIRLYEEYPDFLAILEQFDNYVVNEKIPAEQLSRYEYNIIDLKKVIYAALDKGKADGTIRDDLDVEAFYITITHSLMSLSQKLILRGSILQSDSEIPGKIQLVMLIDMAMSFVGKRNGTMA